MSGPQQAVAFIVFLGVLVTVHELGHFLAAKWAGVKVVKFSIGFGPRIFGFRRGETEYQVAWFPLGGYVKMHGDYPGEEHDYDDPERHRGLYAAPWWKRAIIMAAGPAFNLAFPVLAYFVAFQGETTFIAPRVGWVAADMPAAIAGIKPGDIILKVNGEDIVRFDDISEALSGTTAAVPVTVQRGTETLVFQVNPVITVDESNPIERVDRKLLGIVANASAPVMGVPPGSVAEAAGLKTFDRVLTVDGEAVADEVELIRALEKRNGSVSLQVARLREVALGGIAVQRSGIETVTVEKQPGEGFAALGAESADLYLGAVAPGSPAEMAGLRVGDRLLSVNDTAVKSFFLFQVKMEAHADKPFKLSWRSGTEMKSAQVARRSEESFDEFKNTRKTLIFGVNRFAALTAVAPAAQTKTIVIGVGEALRLALKQVPKSIRMIGLVIAKLFTGDVPLEAVGGPIAVFQVATKSAELGLDTYLMNMAIVSVNLGLVNLLPIPIFDGFALLAAFWEGIRRRPVPLRFREYATKFGLVIIAMLLVLVFKNDITKQFRP